MGYKVTYVLVHIYMHNIRVRLKNHIFLNILELRAIIVIEQNQRIFCKWKTIPPNVQEKIFLRRTLTYIVQHMDQCPTNYM